MSLEPLQIVPHRRGRVTVVELIGALDLAEARRLMATLVQWATVDQQAVVCDLSQLRTPDLSRLLMLFPAAQRRSGPWPRSSLRLAGAGPDLTRRLRRLQIHRFVPMDETIDIAAAEALIDATGARCDLLMDPDLSRVRHLRDTAAALWPVDPLQDDVREDGLLVLSELVTNAIRHVGQSFGVSLAVSPQRFLVAVMDTSRTEPQLRPIDAEATGGRGMFLVASLSHAWGVRLIHGRGKTVWASLNRPPVPEHTARSLARVR